MSNLINHIKSLPKAFIVLLFLALVFRLILAPLDYGGDMYLFEVAAKKTLEGKNIYGMYTEKVIHLFSYPPLFLYVITPLKFVSLKLGIIGDMNPFRVLGKLPAIFADIAIGCLIYSLLRKVKLKESVAALGAFLFLFNPLVIYNTAHYGRFDSVALLSLMLAIYFVGFRSSGVFQGVAIATKTFPLFFLPALFYSWKKEPIKKLFIALLIPICISLPYFLLGPIRFLVEVFFLHAGKAPSFLSWQFSLFSSRFEECYLTGEFPVFCPTFITFVSIVLLAIFLLLTFLFARILVKQKEDAWSLIGYAAIIFPMFILFSKVVYEQYLVWSLPFLILVFLRHKIIAALVLYVVFTICGFRFITVFDYKEAMENFLPYWALGLAVITGICVFLMVRKIRGAIR